MINFVDNGTDINTLNYLTKSLGLEVLEKAIDKSKLHPEKVIANTQHGPKETTVWKKNTEDQKKDKSSSSSQERDDYVKKTLSNSGSQAEKDHIIKGTSKEAQALYDKARSNEKKITGDLAGIVFDLGGRLEGEAFSVKTASSVADKIDRKQAEASEADTKISDEEIVDSMGDLVRYTMMTDHDNIPAATRGLMKTLKDKGYRIIELDNKYVEESSDGKLVPSTKDYKGVHLSVVSPDEQVFELQVHSQVSMDVKNQIHPLYEESRKSTCPPDRREELQNQMKELSKKVPMPKGIMELGKGFKLTKEVPMKEEK